MRTETIEYYSKLKLPADGIIRTLGKRGISQAQAIKAMEIYAADHPSGDVNPMKTVWELCGIARKQSIDKLVSDSGQIAALLKEVGILREMLESTQGYSNDRLVRWFFSVGFLAATITCLYLGTI